MPELGVGEVEEAAPERVGEGDMRGGGAMGGGDPCRRRRAGGACWEGEGGRRLRGRRVEGEDLWWGALGLAPVAWKSGGWTTLGSWNVRGAIAEVNSGMEAERVVVMSSWGV